MHGNPSGTADSHCTYFFVTHPYPRKSFNPACPNIKIGTGPDDGFFQKPEIFMHVCEVAFQIDDWIGNQLSRAVIGNITAPVDMNELRSEEHTSELQSRGHLVCRLLLEKKKNKRTK